MLLYQNLSNVLYEWNTLLVVLTICMGTCNYLAILYEHLCLLIVRDSETRSGISGKPETVYDIREPNDFQ
jgi:hypothetical protein